MILPKNFALAFVLYSMLNLVMHGAIYAQVPDNRPTISREDVARLNKECEVAITGQDVDALSRLAVSDHPGISDKALRGIETLPIPQQKQALAAVLRNDRFWNYDPVHGRAFRTYIEGQYEIQLHVRRLVSQLLNRDLRKESKHYDPDEKKQQKAESMSFEASIIDPVTREKAAVDLLAAK